MFIRVPGTTCEGDFAAHATSHATLKAALEGHENLESYEVITILDTSKVPLSVVATATGFRSRQEATQAASQGTAQPNESTKVTTTARGAVLLWTTT